MADIAAASGFSAEGPEQTLLHTAIRTTPSARVSSVGSQVPTVASSMKAKI